MAIPAPIVGSLISGGLGLLGSAFGTLSQHSANRRMAEFYKQSLAFNKYQYEDSKRYNSLPNQVSLLRQAGVNPALALGSGVGNSSASPVGAPSAPNQGAMDYSSYLNASLTPFGSQEKLNQSQVELNKANTDKAAEDAISQNIANQHANEKWLSEIYNSSMSGWLKEKQADNVKLDNEFLKRSLGDRLMQQSWQSELVRANTEAQLLQNAFLPKMQDEQLKNLIANTKLAVDSGLATIKQAHAAIMNAVTARESMGAQFGLTAEERKRFADASYNYLIQRVNESVSNEFKNIHFNNGANLGFKTPLGLGVNLGGNFVSSYDSSYRKFKHSSR